MMAQATTKVERTPLEKAQLLIGLFAEEISKTDFAGSGLLFEKARNLDHALSSNVDRETLGRLIDDTETLIRDCNLLPTLPEDKRVEFSAILNRVRVNLGFPENSYVPQDHPLNSFFGYPDGFKPGRHDHYRKY